MTVKNAVGCDANSNLNSGCRLEREDIQYTRNNWLCHDFKEWRDRDEAIRVP
jgi:hypothetical protein